MVAKNQVASGKIDQASSKTESSGEQQASSSSTNQQQQQQPQNDVAIVEVTDELQYELFEPPPMPWGYRYFHLWLPRLHLESAWTMLVLNLLIPGLGTFVFGFKWLGFSDYSFEAPLEIRCRITWICIACAFSQLILTPAIVGWGFAILTGLMAVQQAYWIAAVEEEEEDYYYENGYYYDDEIPQPEDGAQTEPASVSVPVEHASLDNRLNQQPQQQSRTNDGPQQFNANEQAGKERKAKRPSQTDAQPRIAPGRAFRPKRKYRIPPGWVYRLYPGFIASGANVADNKPTADATADNKANA